MAKSAVDAFAARLGATWTSNDSTVLSVLGINDAGQSPATGAPFIELTFPVLNERQFTIGAPGSNFYRQEGVARIVVNAKRGKGTDAVLGWCDELAALFRGKLFDNVQTFEVSGPVINDGNDLGHYFQASIAVRYWFYVTG